MENDVKFVKPSGTGNEHSEAKKAPLTAKQSELLGSERTSDAQESSLSRKRPKHAHEQVTGGEQKRQ